MVSVMLLTASLLTVGLLTVRSSMRELREAGASVARERALLGAQATLDLGSMRLRQKIMLENDYLDLALSGFHPPSDPGYCAIDEDCIPGQGEDTPATGQRNHLLNARSDCAGRPCMQHGALIVLADAEANEVAWADLPFASLIDGGDPELRVSLWIRNNTGEVLSAADSATGSWTEDEDGLVVLTALARLRNTEVAIEQEMDFGGVPGASPWNPVTPDEGHGVGHNNDNSSVVVCEENYVGAGGST